MKVISADPADINTKDMEACFGVQMEMVWSRGDNEDTRIKTALLKGENETCH